MRLMPKAEREAMFAIYAFCRMVDDIADDGIGTRAERTPRWTNGAPISTRSTPAAARRRAGSWPAVARFGLRKEDFLAVIDGMDMDVAEDIVAPDLATLDLYCDRVASAVGRLSVKVFGMEEGRASSSPIISAARCSSPTSCAIVDEDAGIGRLYLPREALRDAGIDPRATPTPSSPIRASTRPAAPSRARA